METTMDDKTKGTIVHIAPATLEALRDAKKKTGRTIEHIVREAVREYLEKKLKVKIAES